MKKIIKKMALACAVLVLSLPLLFVVSPAVRAAYNQYVVTKFNDVSVLNLLLRDSGIYDANAVLRLALGATNTFTGNAVFSGGQIGMGSSTVALSTATTTQNSVGQTIACYLYGATPAVEGSLIVAAAPVTGQGMGCQVGAATSGLLTGIGFAKAAASTGSVVNVYYDGFVLVRTTGTVNPGDLLVSTVAAAGYMATIAAPTSGTDMAVAQATGTVGGGLTLARIR